MKKSRIQPDLSVFPECFHPLMRNTPVYDSSCSSAARVYFLDRDGGLYLKTAPKGTLEKEATMTRYFHKKGLGAEVLVYENYDADWLLTARISGEDCTNPMYLDDPVQLCDTTAQLLRMLHDTDFTDCPVLRTADYIATAQANYRNKRYDHTRFPDNWGYRTPEEAWKVVEENSKYLKSDTLLHGDYCLPNIMLDHWQFSGFIDLDAGGIGDRHIDLFWGIWSLQFNLKTHRYRDRFLDVYGRELVSEEMFPIISAFEVFG